MNNSKFQAINGLKGLAACVIAFFWHYQHFGVRGTASPLHSVFLFSYDYGNLMVELFFMLSGFGLMTGYKDRIMAGKICFREFILKRLARLYPLHIFTLLLVLILQSIYYLKMNTTFVYKYFDFYHFLLNLTCLQDGFFCTEWSFNAPSWCISIFLLLYCLFFFVIRTSKTKTAIFFKFFALFIFSGIITKMKLDFPVLNSLVGRGMFSFSIGAMLNLLISSDVSLKKTAIGAASFLFVVGCYVSFRVKCFLYLWNIFPLYISPLLIISAIWFKPMSFCLSLKPVVFLGRISFPIYLLHFSFQCIFAILNAYFNLHINYSSPLIWLAYVIVVLFFATMFELFVADRFSAFLRRCIFNSKH